MLLFAHFECDTPIEITNDEFNQMQENNASGTNFLNVIKAFMYQDLSIIMLGEIRNSETSSMDIMGMPFLKAIKS